MAVHSITANLTLDSMGDYTDYPEHAAPDLEQFAELLENRLLAAYPDVEIAVHLAPGETRILADTHDEELDVAWTLDNIWQEWCSRAGDQPRPEEG